LETAETQELMLKRARRDVNPTILILRDGTKGDYRTPENQFPDGWNDRIYILQVDVLVL
jgi:hypothetical protein